MGDTSTAMRDPMFYRWHKYIDHMFTQYKNTLGPYQLTTVFSENCFLRAHYWQLAINEDYHISRVRGH
jgi:hypothetical protein